MIFGKLFVKSKKATQKANGVDSYSGFNPPRESREDMLGREAAIALRNGELVRAIALRRKMKG